MWIVLKTGILQDWRIPTLMWNSALTYSTYDFQKLQEVTHSDFCDVDRFLIITFNFFHEMFFNHRWFFQIILRKYLRFSSKRLSSLRSTVATLWKCFRNYIDSNVCFDSLNWIEKWKKIAYDALSLERSIISDTSRHSLCNFLGLIISLRFKNKETKDASTYIGK